MRRLAAAAIVLIASLGAASRSHATVERCQGALHSNVCAEQTGFCPASAPVGMAVSDWPAFQHDVQHTGKTPKIGPACTPHAIWSTKLVGRIQSAVVIGPNGPSGQGTIYVPSGSNPIVALDPTDGHVIWSKTTEFGRDLGFGGPVLGNGDFLYVGTRDNDLWAIELPSPPQDPAKVWWRQTVCTDGDVATPPVIGADGLIYMGSDSLSRGSLFAMCPGKTRQVKWCHNPVGGSVTNVSPALSPNGTRLYVTFQGSSLVSYDASTGAEKWRIQLQPHRGNGRVNYSPVVNPTTGRIYVGFNTGLYAVDVQIGPGGVETPVATLLYGTYAIDRARVLSPPAIDVANNAIYFGASRGSKSTLYATTLTGTLKWKRPGLVGSFRNNPPVVDGNGRVYLAAKRTLYALNPLNGTDVWTFPTSNFFVGSPVVTAGRVYLGTKQGLVHALACSP